MSQSLIEDLNIEMNKLRKELEEKTEDIEDLKYENKRQQRIIDELND